MNTKNETSASSWPADGIERILECPVCGGNKRHVLLDCLIDNVFSVAPGEWVLNQCLTCKAAFLDPRPNEASIGLAYARYYTHLPPKSNRVPFEKLGLLNRLKRRFANSYVNERYGTCREPVWGPGGFAMKMLPSIRQPLDASFRYLPKPQDGEKLLDFGCGNGGFLSVATEAGWKVTGVDSDPEAIRAARSFGIDAHQMTISGLVQSGMRFHAITLSHVLEHLHDPQAALRSLYQVLEPGGTIYVDTPNIGSVGAKIFGRNWRGLETPRHLVLFSHQGLSALLNQTGFMAIKFRRRSLVREYIYLASTRIKNNVSPYGNQSLRLSFLNRLRIRIPRSIRREEFLTVTAKKPH